MELAKGTLNSIECIETTLIFCVCDLRRSEAGELRRRQRLEKQSVMANKVKEMKRKQQACEEEARKPKKRRSMMIKIGAGVGLVVCLFCVYAYTKLG